MAKTTSKKVKDIKGRARAVAFLESATKATIKSRNKKMSEKEYRKRHGK